MGGGGGGLMGVKGEGLRSEQVRCTCISSLKP